MIGNSLLEYIEIRTCITCLRLVAPLSIVYTLASWHSGGFLCSRWLGIYALAEASFCLFVYLPRSWLMQKDAVHPPRLSRAEREALFTKCFIHIAQTNMASGWFFDCPIDSIKRENIKEWILWALFGTRHDGYKEEWAEEIDSYIQMLEQHTGNKLDHGWGHSVKCMRLTLDPVVSLHRPLCWYAIVGLVDTITSAQLALGGFKHYDNQNPLGCFPPRWFSLFSRRSPDANLAYWYRPHRSKTKRPVLFLHGIGIGLWPYTPFLFELIAKDPDVGIIAIENLSVSMHISASPLPRAEMLAALTRILEHHHHASFVLAAHSYGTVLAAHMLRDPVFAKRITSLLLIDPIPFLLYLPPVAYNFVYRAPRTASEWQLWYFASRDPDISRALSRHFFWAENVLWKEDLHGRETAIILCGRDQIVDSREVLKYLTGTDEVKFRWRKDQLEVLFFPEFDHSNEFNYSESRRPIVEILSRFIRNGGEAQEVEVRNGEAKN
ncbi:uncharacterized protein LAESUDRAFT_739760 [Laetiporus sulphureus 93-53]|uniref:AB hydrolase-1 domain-containing protein n=1 Tax=Laetiporus sulphureus 93-53 TaxID=1314785 RepID=A0A165B1I2_9APHY|nr:uncharacterized protein LAESUDRAFT_739760 [Laetiporus sulphureus 93-53]KZT00054.1 hypothetical protein LAESUDRAFT_739760 [Laetiporus sulphureus 93-53]